MSQSFQNQTTAKIGATITFKCWPLYEKISATKLNAAVINA